MLLKAEGRRGEMFCISGRRKKRPKAKEALTRFLYLLCRVCKVLMKGKGRRDTMFFISIGSGRATGSKGGTAKSSVFAAWGLADTAEGRRQKT